MGKARLMALAFALALFSSFASAQLTVTIEPENGDFSLYQFESRGFTLSVINTSSAGPSDASVRLEAPQNLALVVGGEERQEQFFSLPSIQPGEARKKSIEVKALSGIGPAQLKAHFGAASLDSSYSTKFEVIESPLSFDLKQSKEPLSGGEEKVEVLLSNNSQGELRSIRAVVLPSKNVSFTGKAFELKMLDSNRPEKVFLSYSEQGLVQPDSVVVRVFFDDSKGMHMLEKTLNVSSGGSRDIVAAVVVLGILGLVAYYFVSKSKGSGGDAPAEKGHGGHDSGHDSKGGHGH